jgi:hypothetical protein
MVLDARAIIAKCLGALWFLDGLLQLQPLMFGQDFVTNVLVPNLSDQPVIIHTIVAAGIAAWDVNTALNNTGVILLQIAIGVLLFFPLSSTEFKIGAYMSIVWSIVVWLCGEGAGLLLTGTASFYTGAPGAVLVYMIIAIFLLVPEKISLAQFPKTAGWIMILGAALQLQSAFWSVDGVQNAAMAYMMEPVHALNAFPTYLSNILAIDPIVSNIVLIALPLLIGLWLVLKPNRAVGYLALVFLLLVWWVGQDFGMLSTLITGTPTDPQTAPLLILLLTPLFFARRPFESVPVKTG